MDPLTQRFVEKKKIEPFNLVVNTSAWYSGDPGFRYRSGDRLT
jgi:hypothetical protein